MAVELVLSRLDYPRPNGRDRWRCSCPVCGGRNHSTLSIGVGHTGAVLLRCWKSGCSAEQIAHAIGLDVQDLFPERGGPGHGAPPLTRRRMLSAAQALELLEREGLLVWTVACDIARGKYPDEPTRRRVTRAAARISALRTECMT